MGCACGKRKGFCMELKCKLCGSKARYDKYSGYSCDNPKCQFNKVCFTETEWQKLNNTWVIITSDPASLPKDNDTYLVIYGRHGMCGRSVAIFRNRKDWFILNETRQEGDEVYAWKLIDRDEYLDAIDKIRDVRRDNTPTY